METSMDPSNCVGLYHWARDLGATGLADCALRYVCQHFAQVWHSVALGSNILSITAVKNCDSTIKHDMKMIYKISYIIICLYWSLEIRLFQRLRIDELFENA